MIPQHGTLEISRSRLRHNLQLLQSQLRPAKLCATIKADAYGHGMQLIAQCLAEEAIEWACVYSLQEAAFLALQSFNTLVLAPLQLGEKRDWKSLIQMAARFDDHQGHSVRVNVTSMDSARQLSALAVEAAICGNIRVHMQIDAGLTRAGVEPSSAPELADCISSLPHLRLEGVFAHFSHGDVPGHPTVQEQTQTLLATADEIKCTHPNLLVHIQNSGAAFHLPSADYLPSADAHSLLAPPQRGTFDLARVGIALYGLQPSTAHPIPDLQPIAKLTAPILAIHDRPASTGVGYGHTFVTKRPSRLAVVPVGYADGYPRALSNNCVAQIRDVDVPVVGRVSMDQIILDITDLPAPIAPGEPVTVISNNPAKPNSLDRMANTLHTISYELATHLGSRLKRIIVD